MAKLTAQLPNQQDWPQLYHEGGMAELLDMAGYMGREQKTELWQLAMHNLLNSEDAAALAEFYQMNKQAKQALKPDQQTLQKNVTHACTVEIEGTEDPDHLEAILSDLYRIEDALDINVKDQVHRVYRKIEDGGVCENWGFDELDEPLIGYYRHPESPNDELQIAVQLAAMAGTVDEMFERLI